MATSSLIAFWVVAIALIAVPGADWAFTISAGLRGRSVRPAVAGLVTGYALVTVVVAAGVGALVAGSPHILTGLALVGGAYLTWHGVLTFARPSTPTAVTDGPAGSDWNTFAKGVGVSGLNPKGLLIFLALLPQFTDADASWPLAGQIGALGAAFMATCAVFYLVLGSVARTVLHARPALARAVCPHRRRRHGRHRCHPARRPPGPLRTSGRQPGAHAHPAVRVGGSPDGRGSGPGAGQEEGPMLVRPDEAAVRRLSAHRAVVGTLAYAEPFRRQ